MIRAVLLAFSALCQGVVAADRAKVTVQGLDLLKSPKLACSATKAVAHSIGDFYIADYMKNLPHAGEDSIMRGELAEKAVATTCTEGFVDMCVYDGEVHHSKGCELHKVPSTPTVRHSGISIPYSY